MILKYVRYSNDKIVLFPKMYDHAKTCREFNIPADTIISAGFVYMDDNFDVTGESVSLGVKSKKEDKDILKAFCR